MARERQNGTTLFYSFLGQGGEEEKDFCEALSTALGSIVFVGKGSQGLESS